MSILTDCIALKKELDALRPLSAEDEQRIMQKFRLDWNYHSNHLEGNSLTYGETKALILFGITAQGKSLKDHFEVRGHNDAILWVLDIIKQDRPLSENFIRELHKLILKENYEIDAITPDGQPTKKKVKVGEYKSTPNHVKTVTGEIFRFATPEETPAKMNDLLAWYNNEKEKDDFNPILLATQFHYKYIRIHPFDDGNGRTARILMNFILLQNGYPPVIIKTEDKDNYFANLRLADGGNIEPFINYISQNLKHSLQLMISGAKGENIEEDDDIDKEIALLKQKVQASGKALKTTKNDQVVLEVFDKSLKPLFTQLSKKCIMLEELYFYTFYQLNYDNQPFPIPYVDKIIDKINKFRTNQLIDFSPPNSIGFECLYSTFKHNRQKMTNYKTSLKISFDKIDYSINSSRKIEYIRKNYDEQLTPEEINRIVNSEIKAHKEFIEQKLKEVKGNQ